VQSELKKSDPAGPAIMENLEVECYSGYRGEETPRRFFIGTLPVGVAQVLDRWLSPDHRYFKLLGDDGARYILRHDPAADRWELIYYDRYPLKSKYEDD
jgi:hypothetical protein